MKRLGLIYKKFWEERRGYFENYLEWVKRIKETVRELFGEDVNVIVFGSVVKNN